MADSLASSSPHRVKTELPERYRRDECEDPLVLFLGVFSLGLGLAEVLAQERVARWTGVRNRTLLRAYGLREIIAGVGILTDPQPAPWLWSRVMGDMLDLGTLGVAYARSSAHDRNRASQAAIAVAAVTALDVACADAHA